MFNFFKKYLRREDEPSQRPSPLAAPSAFKQSLLSLEQRLMFDAAAAATAAEVKSEQVAQDQAEAAVSSEGAVDRTTPEQQASQELLSAMASYSPGESATEVVFVDPTVPDYQTLVAGMGPNVDVVVLDASRDGVEQIAESLAGRSGIDAIHLISHGDAGTLQLGTGTLNAESMSTRYADAFATIQQSLSEQADILVYGCNFAEGEVGQEAVARLAELTGADVEASDDLTGYASLGGDWVLEVKAGAIETRIAIDDQTQMNWVGLLGAPVLDASKSPTLTPLNEDAGAPSGAVGTLVSSLVDFASPSGQVDNVTDGDAGAKLGIAITGANTSNGTWWFSTNDGATWSTLGAVSDASARLLAGDGTARIYFQANADYNGTMSDAITFHAWDQTSGINGGTGSLITTSTVLDQFTTVSYSNNDGTVKWGGSWQELGEADGTGGGMVMVNSYAGLTDNSLQIETDFLSRGASRQVDLSAVTSATLSFDYIREPGGGTKGAVSVEVYDGKTWATLQTFAIDATDGKAQSYKADISAYANANTQIRFIVSGSDSMGRLHVDNIQVAGTGTGGGATAYSTMSDTAALTVTAVNDAPADLSLSASTVAENAANGTVVGTISGTDPDSGDTKAYSLTDTAGGRFAINSSTGVLTVANGALLNYESATSHNVTARVTDSGGLTYDEIFTINLTNVNEAPTGTDATITVTEDTARTLTTADFGFSDVDAGESLSAVRIDTVPGAGTLTLSGVSVTAGQVVTAADISAGNLLFTPAANATGAGYATVTFSVRDSANAYDSAPNTLTINVTAVNDAPISTGGSATGVEDTPLVLTWGQFNVSDVDSAMTANSAVQIQSLPVAGTLQTLVDGDWKSVVVSQIITKDAIDGGNLRYVPVSEQSGYDGYGVPGVGNQRNDYAQFSFAPLQGTSITIANPNAEADVMSEGTWRQGATGWTLHTVSGFSAGVQNLGARQFSVDQDNTFYVEQDGTYLAQTLATTFNSTNDYALSLSIGWRLDQPVSEYSVELWAGGTRLGFIDQSQVTEVQGSLVQAKLQVSGAGFPALNGQALQIRLVGVVMQTNFDNLQLVSYERNTEIGAAAVMTVDITPVNDAPVLADTALSVTVTEDAGVPSGVVGSLVSAFTGGITDVDSGAAKGIAIMGSNETNGTWYYTTNGGSTWTAVGTVSDTSALLLADNGSTRLYFSPNADYNGTSTAALTVRAWDQTSGAVGTKVSTASNGGTTAFSSATDTIDVSVTPINDAPISTGGSVTGVEDTPVVFTWGQFNVSDVDSAMTANSALQIRSLPVLGSLQTLVDGDWKSVAVNQIITKATIDAGNLRYVPVSEQSGYDGYGVSGVGSQRNDYAQFSFAPVQGTPIMMNNPDAQADVIAEGTQQQSVTGWTVNTVSSYTAGVENPTSAQFSGDHDNTFFVESGGTWVGQILYTTPFNSANDYVLSLNVGCQSGLPASQYRIELWAGGTGLGSIDQTQVAEVPGSFTQVTLQVNGGAFASQDGQWFGLWMIGNSGKTYFDNIQLMSYDRNAEVGTAATMTIDITPVNDAPTDLSLSANTVAENAVNGTVVGTVNGTDPDSGDTKAYSLTDNAGGRFAINSVTGQITVANSSLLNYEVATSHNVTVRVTDSGGLTYDETFTINLTDVNEATPTITSNGGGATASISVVENTTAVTTVRATDGDTRQTLTYSISGGADATKFAINTSTGALSFVAAPNYEAPTDNGANNVYNVTVQVSDGNGGTDTQALAVTVTNVNESPTDLSLSASTVAENAANGTVVGTVTGSDVDAGDTKSYTLTNNAGGRFAINRTTGALTVANGTLLNYEAATSHSVTVRVTDRGGLTYDETFTITVTNVNEAPAGTNATVTINEDTTQTFTTANFGFSDVDAGDSFSAVRIETLPTAGTLTLSGTAVTAGQVITTADVAAGNLVFTPAANANGTGYARFTFSVRDSNNAYDPTPNTLTVNVTAVNDAPVVATNSGSNVAEGGVDRITSAELAVVDVDNSAAQLRFSVGTSPAHGRLELTTAPGVSATTFTQADIAANRVTYVHDGSETLSDSFTFTVSDGAGGSIGTTTVTLTIAAVNDAPTIISDGGGATASINVAENVIGITVVTGADVDIPAQALTYGISGGADQALFTINAATGALSFVAPRDFEAAADANGDNVYVVQVRVTDSQGGMATQTIAVTVTDVAERLPSAVPLLPPSLIPTTPPPVIASVPPTHELPSPSVPQEDVSGVTLPAKGLPMESRSLAEHAEGRPAIAAPPRDDNSHRDERPTVALAARQDEGEIRNPFTIVPVEFVASDRTAGLEPTISVSEVLMTKLDELAVLLQEAIGENQKQQAMVAHVTALTGTALSVGFVAWAIRSGALLASCFATIPAWRAFDPLPVVGLSRRERTRRSQDTEATRQAEEAEFEGLHGVLGTSSLTQQPPHSSKKGAA